MAATWPKMPMALTIASAVIFLYLYFLFEHGLYPAKPLYAPFGLFLDFHQVGDALDGGVYVVLLGKAAEAVLNPRLGLGNLGLLVEPCHVDGGEDSLLLVGGLYMADLSP